MIKFDKKVLIGHFHVVNYSEVCHGSTGSIHTFGFESQRAINEYRSAAEKSINHFIAW